MVETVTLKDRFDYLAAVDSLKSAPATTLRPASQKRESLAEHRWHVALCLLIQGASDAQDHECSQAIARILLGDPHASPQLPPALTPPNTPRVMSLARSAYDRYGSLHHASKPDAKTLFLREADKLKDVFRATRLHDNSRAENTAEHSWHVALHALLLADYAIAKIDVARVVCMLLIHDLVEIDAGDIPIHGDIDHAAQAALETQAASRLFGLLPEPDGAALLALWHEFEANETPDAIFAKSLDRVPPICANLANGGGSWVEYNVSFDQLTARVGEKISRGAPQLWTYLDAQVRAFPWFANQFR